MSKNCQDRCACTLGVARSNAVKYHLDCNSCVPFHIGPYCWYVLLQGRKIKKAAFTLAFHVTMLQFMKKEFLVSQVVYLNRSITVDRWERPSSCSLHKIG